MFVSAAFFGFQKGFNCPVSGSFLETIMNIRAELIGKNGGVLFGLDCRTQIFPLHSYSGFDMQNLEGNFLSG